MSKHDVSKIQFQYSENTPKIFSMKKFRDKFKGVPEKQIKFVSKYVFTEKLEQPLTEHYQYDFTNNGISQAAELYGKKNQNNLESLEEGRKIIPVSLPANR